MADLFSMKGRVVLLTGASRGLGRDMAVTLAEAGATVLCAVPWPSGSLPVA